MEFDWSKTLQELENEDWGLPAQTTNLVRKCHELRRVPVSDLTAENCRLLLGQRIGARYLVPIALAYLAKDALEEGHMSPGALIKSVLEQDKSFWEAHPDLWLEVNGVLIEINIIRESLEELQVKEDEFKTLEAEILAQLRANPPHRR